MKTRAHSAGGFTLLELLVVLGVFSLIFGIVFEGLHFAGKADQTVNSRTTRIDRLQSIEAVLRRAIETSYPGYASREKSVTDIAFSGQPDRLTLLAPLPEAIQEGVMARQSFYASDGALIMRWAFDLPGAPNDRQLLLASHITKVVFRYLGILDRDKAPEWHVEWTEQKAFPTLISVQVDLADSSGDRSVTFFAAPQAQKNVDCVLDAIDRSCRRQ